MKTLNILDPVAERQPVSVDALQRVDRIRDRTVGMISNEWRCVKIMFPYLADMLVQRDGAAGAFITPVEVAGSTPPEILDDVARRSDAAIVAIAH